jgi:hypothetical protein
MSVPGDAQDDAHQLRVIERLRGSAPDGEEPPSPRYARSVNIVDELHAVSGALRATGIPHAICGGIAVTIHGAIRTTKDIDVLVARADVSRALDAVRPIGFEYASLPMTFDAGTPRELHVQRVSKLDSGHHLALDLIVAEGPLATMLADRIDVALPEGTLTVVSRAALIEMKRLAGRAQDLADIEKLEASDEG